MTILFDRKLDHPGACWRKWMTRRGGDHLAASESVGRETLARFGGKSCSIDLLINDIREEPRGRSYDLVAAAGGWKHLIGRLRRRRRDPHRCRPQRARRRSGPV